MRTADIHLAWPVDALVDTAGRLVGFEVAVRNGDRCFLPVAAAQIREDEIAVSSPLVLDDRALGYYRAHTTRAIELGFAEPWIDEHGMVCEALSAA